MKFSFLASLLREWDFFGTFSRPDNSGIRGKGGPALSAGCMDREKDYPYDFDDDEYMYGQPNGFDYGRAGNNPGRIHNPITPKNVDHSSFDDAEEDWPSNLESEAMGTPTNFGISNDGQFGSSVPGAVGHGWNDKPVRPWDEEEGSDHVELIGRMTSPQTQDEGMGPFGMNPNGALRKGQPIPNDGKPLDDHETAGEDDAGFPTDSKPEAVTNEDPEYLHDVTDEDLELKIDRIYGRDDNPDFKNELSDPEENGSSNLPSKIAIVATNAPFMQGKGHHDKSTRGMSSTNMWQESAWRDVLRRLNEADVIDLQKFKQSRQLKLDTPEEAEVFGLVLRWMEDFEDYKDVGKLAQQLRSIKGRGTINLGTRGQEIANGLESLKDYTDDDQQPAIDSLLKKLGS